MKLIHEEIYEGYSIKINARYLVDYYDWDEGYTNAVRLYYYVRTPLNSDMYIDGFEYRTIGEKKPYKILFWKVYPKTTFEEDVRNRLNELIEYIKSKIEKRLLEKKMTDGLLDSLKSEK
jgi:hypothetical protein